MAIAAIPTSYAGVQFRSRLEARWAAMFDLLHWRWEYEPIDLRGYIPDFILMFSRPLLIEVKPIVGRIRGEDLVVASAVDRIHQSGWTDEAIIVGASVEPTDEWGSPGAQLGNYAIDESIDQHLAIHKSSARLGTDAVAIMCGHCKRPSLCSIQFSWRCRVCGVYVGNVTAENDMDTHGTRVLALWREAGNRVQWKSPTQMMGG